MRAYVGCVGCEQRQLDAARIETFLTENGVELSRGPESAELNILVTCAVDERSEGESLLALNDLLERTRPGGRIFVGGCLPSISPERLEGRDLDGTFSPRDMGELDRLLGLPIKVPMRAIPDAFHAGPSPKASDSPPAHLSPRREFDRAKRGFKLRINHGCLLSCSYCVIRLATGRLESIPMPTLINAFRDAAKRGEASVMVLGGDTGAYGLDIGTDFPRLLHKLLQVEDAPAIFVHDLNINWVLKDLPRYVQVLSESSRSPRAMTLPIQSGSNAVLGRMRRPYQREAVLNGWARLRAAAPSVSLGTHIIAGFPGESDKDFGETMSMLEILDPDFVTCFRFSPHPRAPSSKLDAAPVSEEEKLDRLKQLRGLLGRRATVLL